MALGMSYRNVQEFATPNMNHFNAACPDHPDVQYASFGAWRKELQHNELLRANWQTITDHAIEVRTDGMTTVDEVKWGTYLVTFEHDHFEVAGLNPRVGCDHVANLLMDQARIADRNNN